MFTQKEKIEVLEHYGYKVLPDMIDIYDERYREHFSLPVNRVFDANGEELSYDFESYKETDGLVDAVFARIHKKAILKIIKSFKNEDHHPQNKR